MYCPIEYCTKILLDKRSKNLLYFSLAFVFAAKLDAAILKSIAIAAISNFASFVQHLNSTFKKAKF